MARDDYEVAKAVNGTKHSPALLQNAVSRLVKQAGADTTLKNALRDGAEFAWIPRGDTCAFCLTLASRGWQRASKKALKNGHAEHIHANCDCEYAVRFHSSTTVAGYDPEQYLAAYEEAEGKTPREKINSLRRAHYAENRKKITAQKRAAYLARKGSTDIGKSAKLISEPLHSFVSEELFKRHFAKHVSEFGNITAEEYLRRASAMSNMPVSDDVVQLVRSDGSVSKYCFSTNEFVVTTDDGDIRTYFKPKEMESY